MVKFTTTIIGSGSAKPDNGNLSSCQLVNYNNTLFLVDCCDGACTELLRMGFSINKIDYIFITHAHGDHCLGLPCLIATMALNSKQTPLTVYAPKEVFDIMVPVIDAIAGDHGRFSFKVDYVEVSTQEPTVSRIYGASDLSVFAVPLRHGVHETYGYIFAEEPKQRHINIEAVLKYNIPRGAYQWIREHDWEMDDGTIIPNEELTTPPEPSRAYAYISDTYAFDILSDMLKEKEVSTLYCEASFQEADKDKAVKFQHCTAKDAATVAKKAETVKYLIIGHISARYGDPEGSVKEAKEIFPITVYAAKDAVIDIQ